MNTNTNTRKRTRPTYLETELVIYYNYDPPEPDSPVRHPSRRLTSDVATDSTYLFGAPRRHGSGMAPARFWHTFGV